MDNSQNNAKADQQFVAAVDDALEEMVARCKAGEPEEEVLEDYIEAIREIPVTERPIETMARPESRWVRATDEDIAQQELAKANIEDKVAQKRAKNASDPVDERLRAANRLLSQQVTNEQNHFISNKSLLHGLGGDHEVLSAKVERQEATTHKLAVNQFLENEAAEAERKEQAAFRKEVRAFMDEFRADAYRKDGSLDF